MSRSMFFLGFTLFIFGILSLLSGEPFFLFSWFGVFLFNIFIHFMFGFPSFGIHAVEWVNSLLDEVDEIYQDGKIEESIEEYESVKLIIKAYKLEENV